MVQTNDQGQCGEFSGLDNLIIIKSAGEIPQLFLRGRIMQVSQPRTGLSKLNGPRLFIFSSSYYPSSGIHWEKCRSSLKNFLKLHKSEAHLEICET